MTERDIVASRQNIQGHYPCAAQIYFPLAVADLAAVYEDMGKQYGRKLFDVSPFSVREPAGHFIGETLVRPAESETRFVGVRQYIYINFFSRLIPEYYPSAVGLNGKTVAALGAFDGGQIVADDIYVEFFRERGSGCKPDVIVVISAYDENRAYRRKFLYTVVKNFFRFRRRRVSIEHVARDEGKFNLLFAANTEQLVKYRTVFVEPLPAHKFFTDMQIGSMQNSHLRSKNLRGKNLKCC